MDRGLGRDDERRRKDEVAVWREYYWSGRAGISLAFLLVSLFCVACAANQGSRSLPPEVESAIGTINDEIAAERYDKIYNEASELWRQRLHPRAVDRNLQSAAN